MLPSGSCSPAISKTLPFFVVSSQVTVRLPFLSGENVASSSLPSIVTVTLSANAWRQLLSVFAWSVTSAV